MTMSYYCFICDSLIRGNMFKAYDQNLCSSSCREYLIKEFNFNCNYELEEKQEKPSKKSISCMKIIKNPQPEPEYKPFTNDEGQPLCINLYGLFNLIPKVSKEEINEQPTYEKRQRKTCFNIYTTSYSDLTFRNMINKLGQKAKNFLNLLTYIISIQEWDYHMPI